ncbi:hypothetical protein A1O3_08386 [Capronia epimyces CBS 606.96]|uniref:Uncharacterized protein n=1 Tax=Capronia epimyces CBS 606.96 TaxID=1182542 RepID=W9XRY8_9EURO|nr:uncharacterized protein A1O3_08386 [Capronia epimyces CBS 606.96]EXJ80100.1 hypothetical protein A1O3_08386 [Capronia epimyces CBS 606.96]
MAVETIPDPAMLKEAFGHGVYSSDGSRVQFGSLFGAGDDSRPAERQVLVIFIRHFFCGNCQEYVRRLSSPESPFHPSRKRVNVTDTHSTASLSEAVTGSPPAVILIGPGLPSLIPSYAELTQCPYPVYADPSTRLYSILGMHRTLSLGPKTPGYIQHSLVRGAVKSAWQVVKRVGSGDAMGGGDWDVNGGEFLFVRHDHGASSARRAASSTRAGSAPPGWEVHWCHRMLNSRDHTEPVDLQYHTCSSTSSGQGNARANPLPHSILVDRKQGYSSNCRGSCPGPDIPRFREQVLLNQASHGLQPRRLGRTGSRCKSSGSCRAELPTVVPSARAAPQSEMRASSFLTAGTQPPARPSSPIEEEDEPRSRKSFTASIVDRVGVLVRTRSVSTRPARSATQRSGGGIFRRGLQLLP